VKSDRYTCGMCKRTFLSAKRPPIDMKPRAEAFLAELRAEFGSDLSVHVRRSEGAPTRYVCSEECAAKHVAPWEGVREDFRELARRPIVVVLPAIADPDAKTKSLTVGLLSTEDEPS